MWGKEIGKWLAEGRTRYMIALRKDVRYVYTWERHLR